MDVIEGIDTLLILLVWLSVAYSLECAGLVLLLS